MFATVKCKLDLLFDEGFSSRYPSSQIAWERLRTEEKVLLKKIVGGKLERQILAVPDKLGVYFRDIPVVDDYCRFHEGEICKGEE
ncbi:MAG TPA: hypothetical protein PLI51_07880 [bacterium]|nr:hypothetical protein [bacterium]HPQ66627.1 hypothetical protein [bacterium]